MVTKTPLYDYTKVAKLIDFRGLRRDWVADQLGVHYSYVSKLLSGDRPITEEIAQKLSFILAVPTSFFATDDEGKAA